MAWESREFQGILGTYQKRLLLSQTCGMSTGGESATQRGRRISPQK